MRDMIEGNPVLISDEIIAAFTSLAA